MRDKHPHRRSGSKQESSDKMTVRFVCRKGNSVKTRHVSFGIFPCVKSTSLKEDAYMAINATFRHVEAEGKPSNKSKKGGAKGSVATMKESCTIGLCISRFLSKKICSTCIWKTGNRNTPSNSPMAPGAKFKTKFGKERVHSRGIIQKCAPHERSPCAPKSEERSHVETLIQERCARKAAWYLAKNIFKLKNSDKATFYVPGEVQGNAWRPPLQRDQRSDYPQSIQHQRCTS